MSGEWVRLLPGSGDINGYSFSREANAQMVRNSTPRLPIRVGVGFNQRFGDLTGSNVIALRVDDDGGVSGEIVWDAEPLKAGDQIFKRVAPAWLTDYVDPDSEQHIGPVLTEVALTNDNVPLPWKNDLRHFSAEIPSQ